MTTLRIALAQINPTVGDLRGNEAKILDHIARARDLGAGIVAFPELAVTGYPPEDLLLKPSFVESNSQALERIASRTIGIVAIVGFVDRDDDIYNAAAVLCSAANLDQKESWKVKGLASLSHVSFDISLAFFQFVTLNIQRNVLPFRFSAQSS